MNIYLINQEGTNYYKIGITKKNPELRAKELQIGNAEKLNFIVSFVTAHGFKMEAAVHARYKLQQVNSEWFELTDEEVSMFIDVCTKLEESITFLKNSGNPFI
jgi:hypothetical protein